VCGGTAALAVDFRHHQSGQRRCPARQTHRRRVLRAGGRKGFDTPLRPLPAGLHAAVTADASAAPPMMSASIGDWCAGHRGGGRLGRAGVVPSVDRLGRSKTGAKRCGGGGAAVAAARCPSAPAAGVALEGLRGMGGAPHG